MSDKFEVIYNNTGKPEDNKRFLVREEEILPYHYLISDGKSHVGGGKLLRKYCTKVEKTIPIKFKEEIDVRNIVIIWQYDSYSSRTFFNVAENIEDAYDLIVNFLHDKFQLTKEEVIQEFARKRSDYLDLYNPDKISEQKVNWDGPDFESGEYFFRLWETKTRKVK